MSKIAEKALKTYPDDMGTFQEVKYLLRTGFIKGYEQAEKDLALTLEDVAYIVDTFYFVEGNTKEKCEEVIKRFNEKKEQS